MYWFLRGTQSALFYYASCTPCIEKARKRKVREEAKREREEREYIQLHNPTLLGQYHMQPAPFTTNPHWEADFACPNTPRPGRVPKKSLQRGNSTASKSTAQARHSGVSDASQSIQPSPSLRPLKSGVDSLAPPGGSAWDRHQNQREDDEIWGFEYTDGTFHTGPARPRSGTGTSETADLRTISRDGPSSSPFLSPLAASRPQTSRSNQGGYSAAPFLADINDMIPPSVALPDEYENGNAWFRQPPPDRLTMRNSASNSPTLSARSRPSTRGREPELRRQISNRMLEQQLSKTELLSLPGPALSRTSTQRSVQRRRAGTLEKAPDPIPDILDDNYIPPSSSYLTQKPSTSHSTRSSHPSPTPMHHVPEDSATSTIHRPPPTSSSEDTSGDADAEDSASDSDSGVGLAPAVTTAPAPAPRRDSTSPSAARQRPVRTTTAPGPHERSAATSVAAPRPAKKAAVRGKSYLVTAAAQTLVAGQRGGSDSEGGIGGDESEEDEEDEDPRWTWTRLRRWSADL